MFGAHFDKIRLELVRELWLFTHDCKRSVDESVIAYKNVSRKTVSTLCEVRKIYRTEKRQAIWDINIPERLCVIERTNGRCDAVELSNIVDSVIREWQN